MIMRVYENESSIPGLRVINSDDGKHWDYSDPSEFGSSTDALVTVVGNPTARHPCDWDVPCWLSPAFLDDPNEPELPFAEND